MNSYYWVAIVGSRGWSDPRAIQILVKNLKAAHDNLAVVSGGAAGADSMAEIACRRSRVPFFVIPARWDRDGKRAGMIRNVEIVNMAREVHAFWDGTSPGTAHTISMARKADIPVFVLTSNA